jgi:adenylate cyclase
MSAMRFSRLAHRLARWPHRPIRWALIGLLMVWATVQTFWLSSANSDLTVYDQMVKRRLWAPPADAAIVVVDIDEASLAFMKDEFGRWPWPRETLAGVLDWFQLQQTRAVVFDILFADMDVLNQASDDAFSRAVEASHNSYFPILRLNPANDALSQLRADRLPGFARALNAQAAPTVAVVPPVFESIIQSGRMGYHNIYADQDGVNRHYRLWEDVQGWRLSSLPARLAIDLDWPLPSEPQQLIQFARTAHAYTRIPFSEVWQLSQTQAGKTPDPRFRNAIVLVGSTATNLYDVKVSPLDINHPGVFVLANVIDNLKNRQFLHELPTGLRWLLALLLLVVMGLASERLNDAQLKWSTLVAPGLLLGISFFSLHTGLNWYLDLTPSASQALLFFSVFSAYQSWRIKQLSTIQLSTAWSKPDAPLVGCHRLVLRLSSSRKDVHALADALQAWPGPAHVIGLGDVHQPFDARSGLCHVRLWFSAGQEAHLPAWLSAHRKHWQKHHLTTRHAVSIRESMDDVWQDVSLAVQHWNSSHENT